MLITQSNYIPWRGYFANLRAADEVVFLNSVQFTKRDWRNRNLIEISGKPEWLTIPVDSSGSQSKLIKDMIVVEKDWAAKHLRKIEQAYRKFPNYADLENILLIMELHRNEHFLIDITVPITTEIMRLLAIKTRIRQELDLSQEINASERLLKIAKHYKAKIYLTAPAASSYLDTAIFDSNGISVEIINYSNLACVNEGDDSSRKLSIIDEIARYGLEIMRTRSKFN